MVHDRRIVTVEHVLGSHSSSSRLSLIKSPVAPSGGEFAVPFLLVLDRHIARRDCYNVAYI